MIEVSQDPIGRILLHIQVFLMKFVIYLRKLQKPKCEDMTKDVSHLMLKEDVAKPVKVME